MALGSPNWVDRVGTAPPPDRRCHRVFSSPQVEYLLKKICTAMNVELNSCELDDLLSQEPQGQGGLTVWQFLDVVNSGRFLRGIEQEAISMAVEEVYQEVIEDVLKQARSPHTLGHGLRPAASPF